MVFVIGRIQGHVSNSNGPADGTYQHTPEERRGVADAMARGEYPEVPLYIDHGGAEHDMNVELTGEPTVVVLPRDRAVGVAHDTFVDGSGAFYGIAELDDDRPETKMIVEESARGIPWGFSAGTDVKKVPGHILSKKFNHFGITRNPEWGEAGYTWLYDGAKSKESLYDILKTKYFNMPGMYVPKELRERCERANAYRSHRDMQQQMTVGATKLGNTASKPDSYTSGTGTVGENVASSAPMSTTATLSTPDGRPIDIAPPRPLPTEAKPQQQQQQPYEVAPVNDINLTPNAFLLAKQQEQQQQQELARNREMQAHVVNRINEDVDKLFQNINLDSDESYTDVLRLEAILKANESYDNAIAAAGWKKSSEYPQGTNLRRLKVESYIDKAQEILNRMIGETHKNDEDRAAMLNMAKDPLRFRPVMTQVLATKDALMRSEKQMQESLNKEREMEKERLAREERDKARDKELADLKEAYERVEKRARETEERDSSSKRARTDTYTPAASIPVVNNTTPVNNTNGTYPNAWAAMAAQDVTVGATKFLPPGQQNVGLRQKDLQGVEYIADYWSALAMKPEDAKQSAYFGYASRLETVNDTFNMIQNSRKYIKQMPLDGPPIARPGQ